MIHEALKIGSSFTLQGNYHSATSVGPRLCSTQKTAVTATMFPTPTKLSLTPTSGLCVCVPRRSQGCEGACHDFKTTDLSVFCHVRLEAVLFTFLSPHKLPVGILGGGSRGGAEGQLGGSGSLWQSRQWTAENMDVWAQPCGKHGSSSQLMDC